MTPWVWFVVVPIWIAVVGVLVTSVRLHVRAASAYRREHWVEATNAYERVSARNLIAVGLMMLTVIVMRLGG